MMANCLLSIAVLEVRMNLEPNQLKDVEITVVCLNIWCS